MISPILFFFAPSPIALGKFEYSARQNYIKNPLKSSYFVFDLTKNDPTIHTQEQLEGRHATYYFGYRNQVASSWMMGLGFNYKSFSYREDKTELSFLSIQHEAYYLIRLYHPTFLMIGPNLLFLLPTQRSHLPVLKEPDFESEIGAGFSLTLATLIQDKYLFSIRIGRWRGTRTNKFHALETAAGVSVKI